MTAIRLISILFYVAAAYDFILGVAFLLFAPQLFQSFQVPPPNHWGYVQFPALLLMVFGMLFYTIAVKPHGNKNLIPYGMLLKMSYCGVVFWHWATGDIPCIWKPFAIADLVFLIAFVWAYVKLGHLEAQA
jgi:hypothetical protein